jgi:hypothetical protein
LSDCSDSGNPELATAVDRLAEAITLLAMVISDQSHNGPEAESESDEPKIPPTL